MTNQDSNKILIKFKEIDDVGTPVVLAGQTSASLDLTKEMIEYTSKTTTEGGIPVRKYLPTRSTATINVEALYDPTGAMTIAEVLEIVYNGTKVDFVLGDDSASNTVISGEGYFSAGSHSYDMDSVATGSFTIQVDGGLSFDTVS
ncbi:hypothetical protein J2X69_003045 [Algoriphagus sp. 4150]|uniref:phage tail tube protein n=1 Tax=Algoriphagus sp. 4150 TaxID=2817756 RepID=UPI0028659A3D|nr:phage tail tube protein [Algoriphagus sp. 4150]MDR7130688.1 hypothetical protein [Algoriphagus sp. 4150]